MSRKRRTVQQEDIIAINEAYAKIGTYAGAGRATGWSGGTVKRYIIENYVPEAEQKPIQKINFIIPDIEKLSYPESWEEFLTLSEDEEEDIAVLQETIVV